MSDEERHAEIRALCDLGEWHQALMACRTAEDRAALRDLLLDFLPAIRIENGIEVDVRPVEPDDHVKLTGAAQAEAKKHLADPMIFEAAELLASDALDTVDGNPACPEDDWAAIEADMRAWLGEVADAAELTKGDGSLSRAGHARRGLEALDELATAISWARGECVDPDEVAWLNAIIGDVARVAFVAGRHAQAAWGKDFEADAVKGRKRRELDKRASDTAAAKHRPRREQILRAMRERILEGDTPWNAAHSVAAAPHHVGKSGPANYDLWKKYGNPR